MPYIAQKKFEENIKSCKLYLKTMESIKPLPKIKYPNIPDFGSCIKEIKEMKYKIFLDNENHMIKSQNKNLKKEIKWCKKNLEDLTNSKKESILGLISYKKIHTLNWRKVNLPEFVKYLQSSVNTYKLFPNKRD